MRKPLNLAVTIIFICTSCICISCQKVFEERSIEAANNPQDRDPVSNKSILVDASRDGGGWWFPQRDGNTFDPSIWHQGTGLVEYFKSLGYTVDELPRGATVTKEMLRKYRRVVRAGYYGLSYTKDEIEAYQEFLKGQNALLLFTDHSASPATDQLTSLLGLQLEGIYFGPITRFNKHEITTNVTSLIFNAGSVIKNPDADNITVLAYYDDANLKNAAAMGILKHRSCKIVFIGDINGLEQIPQPLTDNLVKWLF